MLLNLYLASGWFQAMPSWLAFWLIPGALGGATATKLRFCLAVIWAFVVRQEPPPRTPGHVLTPLNAVKPGPSVRVAPGHACLARLLADTGRVWGAMAGNWMWAYARVGLGEHITTAGAWAPNSPAERSNRPLKCPALGYNSCGAHPPTTPPLAHPPPA